MQPPTMEGTFAPVTQGFMPAPRQHVRSSARDEPFPVRHVGNLLCTRENVGCVVYKLTAALCLQCVHASQIPSRSR